MREGETPVPIPNTTVKTFTADGTMRATAWESRWLPDIFINMIFISDEKLLLKVTASDDWWKSVRASGLDVIRTLKTEYRQANIDWRVMKNQKWGSITNQKKIQAMIGEHESVQQVRKDIKIVDQSNLHTTLCMERRTASQNYKGYSTAWSRIR